MLLIQNCQWSMCSLTLQFEYCKGCLYSCNQECPLKDQCTDSIRLLRKEQEHYSGLRNMLKILYKARQANHWMFTLDRIFNHGSWTDLLKHCALNAKLPSQVKKQIDASVKSTRKRKWLRNSAISQAHYRSKNLGLRFVSTVFALSEGSDAKIAGKAWGR